MPMMSAVWPLADTVKPYGRHVLACTGTTDWPARIEDAPGLLGRMARDVRDLRDRSPAPPKLTATDRPTPGPGLDLLVFPEAVCYPGVDEASWPAFLRDPISSGEPPPEPGGVPLLGDHVFVCVNQARDERCGRCGPPVLAALREACAGHGLDGVTLQATSHVGGHKYAGNVLIYPGGVWYGHVRPEDAIRIVRQHLMEGRIVEDLCRGRMAMA